MKPPYFGAALVAFCFPIHSILLTLSRSPGVCIDRLCALRHNQYGPFANFGEVTLVVHGFEAGQLVVCRYRLPGELQPWIHEVHIGEVVEPGDDPAKRNTRNLGWLLRHTSEVQRIRFFPDPAGNVFGVYEHRPH